MPSDQQLRASPDALLALADREKRGHLKIFLGASPGVGKTYAMLQAARAAQADGADVAIGVIETHGRRETEALLSGLEILPRQPITYRGRVVMELDLDAALARTPALMLIDEYAHSNVPGSRHPKRWQDIQELLAAGIHVWTTLNIQHLESLNDVIQRITKVRVRETVPDRVFEEADEIVLVDLPPDELLKRLAAGKVYIQDTAARAVEHFFRPGNLLALRELMMRRAAERIDSALVERMQGGAIEGPWAAGERILVCVGPDRTSLSAVRHGKRLANLIGVPWMAVTVERPAALPDKQGRQQAEQALRLAESLGAESKTLVGSDLPAEILRFAKFENVTQIVIGRPVRGRLMEMLGRSLAHQLVRRADGIAIHVVTAEADTSPPPRRLTFGGQISLPGLTWSAVAVALVIAVGRALTAYVSLPNISLIFLMAVLFSAMRYGFWPAVFASLLSFLGYNYFFIEPLYTLTVAQPHEVLALFVFLVTAVITSALAARSREQTREAVSRVRATRRLYEFSKKMASLVGMVVPDGAAAEIHSTIHRPAVILLPEKDDLVLTAAWPPLDDLDPGAMSAARWTFSKGEPAGANTDTLPTVPWLFLPLRTGKACLGVLGVAAPPDGSPLDGETRTLLETLAEQTAVALDRAQLSREMTEVKTAAETERIRNTLLASISHDFRTPLASVLGASTSLLDYGEKLDVAATRDLLRQIKDEALHLDGMVRNLLSMTRLEAGALELHHDWLDLREAIDRAVANARRRGATQRFDTDIPSDCPLVRADPHLLDQALGNLIENAVKYAGAEAHITVSAHQDGEMARISVSDDGPGIAPELLPHIFEKFTRISTDGGDGGDGTGLGLAIAKGIIEAHGGAIEAQSPLTQQRGARISFSLPLTAHGIAA